MAIKTRAEIEARKAIPTEPKVPTPHQDSFLSFTDLKKMNLDQLVDRWEAVDAQADLIKWRILWEIRCRFPSDRQFGQYLADLRDNQAISLSCYSQHINRHLNAGRFCAEHEITDISKAGVKKSVIYELGRPNNFDIAGDIYAKIKGNNIRFNDVKRMIEQAKAVLTIEKEQQNGKVQKLIDGEEIANEEEEKADLSENELIEYLQSEHKLLCKRIDNKRSGNQHKGRNHWLHPDIVAMQPVDKEWNELVRQSSGQRARLWSFEVKTELTVSNVRESFFQAVSNSSWADEGYLVTARISDKVEQELRMLSPVHHIGVILLNPENPTKSQILLYAKSRPDRPEPDWASVSRVTEENEDFKDFMEQVNTYKMTGQVRNITWNKIV